MRRKCPHRRAAAIVAERSSADRSLGGRCRSRDTPAPDVDDRHAAQRPAPPPARLVDRDLLARHRPVSHPRPCPRDRRARLLRRRRRRSTRFTVAFQVPNPIRALVADAALSARVRPGLQRPAGEGRARRAHGGSPRASSGCPARARRADRALHPDRAAGRCAPFGYQGERELAVGLSRMLFPIVVAARRLRDRRRDPEQLRRVRHPGADPGRLEPRDHRRPRHRRPARRQRRTTKLYVYAGSILVGDHRPGAAADPVAARARRPAAARASTGATRRSSASSC